MISQAMQAFAEGRLADAERFCKLSLVDIPYRHDAFNLLGGIRGQSHDNRSGARLIGRAITLAGGVAAYHYNHSLALFELGQRAEAIASLGRSLELNPSSAEAWHDVGVALIQDNSDKAFLCLGRSAVLRPDFALAQRELGKLLEQNQRLEFAERRFRRALLCDPNDHHSHNDLGRFHFDRRDFTAALPHFRHALILAPGDRSSISNVALTLQLQGATDEALSWHQHSVEIDPANPRTLANMGGCLQIAGRLAQSHQMLQRATELAPENAEFHYAYAQCRQIEAGDPQIAAMEALLADNGTAADQIFLHFALAKAYGDSADHQRAFDHLLKGNAAKYATIGYDAAAVADHFSRVKQFFTGEFIAGHHSAGSSALQPIFILGMPRSGSSLVEQILASHPDIHGAGELTDLKDLVGELGNSSDGLSYPESLTDLPTKSLRELGDRYIERQMRRCVGAKSVTDKTPGNFWLVGLIHLAFPNARIIHTRREPIDTCLSCFSKLFTYDALFSYDLLELGRYWRHYHDLMAHWRAVLPQDRMLEIDYEQLVADLPGETRRMLDYCGLDWDESCLSFHQTARPVDTASSLQVRRPLYKESVQRWRPAAGQLAPLLKGLAGDE